MPLLSFLQIGASAGRGGGAGGWGKDQQYHVNACVERLLAVIHIEKLMTASTLSKAAETTKSIPPGGMSAPQVLKCFCRFWVLEVVARMPYFAYISMLHLYESLGWWRAGAELRRVSKSTPPLHHSHMKALLCRHSYAAFAISPWDGVEPELS